MFDSNAPGAERITAPTWDQVSNGVLSVSVTINGRSANIAGPNGYLQTWNAGDGNLGHTEFDAFARNVNADGNSDFVSFAFPSLALPTSLQVLSAASPATAVQTVNWPAIAPVARRSGSTWAGMIANRDAAQAVASDLLNTIEFKSWDKLP